MLRKLLRIHYKKLCPGFKVERKNIIQEILKKFTWNNIYKHREVYIEVNIHRALNTVHMCIEESNTMHWKTYLLFNMKLI